MRTPCALLAAVAATSLAAGALAAPGARRASNNGTITTNGAHFISQADYVVVGGGLAGLVVAGRLSEDADVQVAVIEAGPSGEGDQNLTTPSANLYASSTGTDLDWQYKTTAQQGLGGRQAAWPRGKTLGGSAAINGLYGIRPNAAEVDAWADLVNTTTAQSKWGWDNLLAAMKKSESFTPPKGNVTNVLNSQAGKGANVVQYNSSTRGNDGPIHMTWPGQEFANVGAYVQAVNNLGVPVNPDPYGGNNTGPFVATSTINPSNWTRSWSRTGYLDPLLGARPNLHVLVGYQATKIDFDTSNASSAKATGVTFSAGNGQATHTINATREVILSGGSIGSPQLLQLSGVGNKTVLDAAGVQQTINLPGVGFNLQDHLSSDIAYAAGNGVSIPPSKVTGNEIVDSYVNSATAYLPLSFLLGSGFSNFTSTVKNEINRAVAGYSAPPTVQQGYRAVLNKLVDLFPTVGPIEILLADTFGTIQLQVALQHPVSRGSVQIASNNAFDDPNIDAGYLSDPSGVDQLILRSGFQAARRIGQAAPLQAMLGSEQTPGTSVQSNDDWDKYIAQTGGTEFHPSSTCSMLPKELGGVVDEDLIVYGTSNLRVADASVPPLSMSMHLMTLTYGLGEIAADIIKSHRKGLSYPSGTPLNASSSSNAGQSASGAGGVTSATGGASGAKAGNSHDHASSSSPSASVKLGCTAALVVAAMSFVAPW